MSSKKNITPPEIENDPLWQYSGFELATMPYGKLQNLLRGPGGNKQYLPGRAEAYAKKILEWRNSNPEAAKESK